MVIQRRYRERGYTGAFGRIKDQIAFIVLILAMVFPSLLHHIEPFQAHQALLAVGVRIHLLRFPQYQGPISRGQKIEDHP
jgi:hypothetical protein